MAVLSSCFLAAALVVAEPLPAAAQGSATSILADVPLPVAPAAAPSDPTDGAAAAALDTEAEGLGASCGEREFFLWEPENNEASRAIYEDTMEAFRDAGWTLAEIRRVDDRIAFAGSREEEGVLMGWNYPGSSLLMNLCAIPAATAQTVEGNAPVVADDEEATDPAVVAGGIVVLGLALILWRVLRKRRRQAIAAWPQTYGTVVHHDVEEVDTSTADDNSADYRYDPKILYRYEAEGKTLECRRFGLDEPRFDTREAAERHLLERYPLGSHVSVFYNPAKPGDAVLEQPAQQRGAFWTFLHWLIIVIGVALVLFGLLGLIGALAG